MRFSPGDRGGGAASGSRGPVPASRFFRLASLRGKEPSGPVALAFLVLTFGVLLYLLQGTCPDASSVRYLVVLWVALPGLLAAGILELPATLEDRRRAHLS